MKTARPRILHVVTSLAVGGAQRHLATLLAGLRDSYDCDLIYFKDPDMVAELRPLVGDLRAIDLSGPAAFLNVWRLAAHIRRGRYRIVHTHLLKADMWGLLAARLAGVRAVVATKHNTEARLRNPLYALLHGGACRSASRVVAISSAVAEYMTTVGRARGNNMAVIHYGLEDGPPVQPDAAMRVRMGFGIGMNLPLVLCAARLDPQKDHETLLRAWRLVLDRLPSSNLILAGGPQLGGQAYAAGVKSLANDLGLAGKVIFAGVRRDIPDLMAACDVFTMSSRWEGLGLVLLEAMRTGRPVVATRVGGIPEVVAHGETGLLVPPGEPAALAAALVELLDNRKRAKAFGEAGRRRFETRFTADKMVGKFSDVYAQLVGQQTVGRPQGPLTTANE